MGTKERRRREIELRRKQIQDAATKLFFSKGLKSTTMDDIAKLSELSMGTLYQYFKSKDELYVSLNVSHSEYTLSRIEKINNNRKLSPEEKVLGLKDALYDSLLYEPRSLSIIFHTLMEDTLENLSRDMREQILEIVGEVMRQIASIFEEGIAQDKFLEGNRTEYADILFASFLGLVIWEEAKRKINPNKDYIKTTLDKSFEILLRGIKKK